MIRLVAIDLDGTLLHSDGSVSGRNRAALARAHAAGVRIVVTTGRPPRLVYPLAAQIGVADIAICANGAIVVELATGTVLDHRPLAGPVARRLVVELRRELPGIVFSLELGLDFAREPAYHAAFRPPPAPRYADALELVEEPVTKLLARHPTAPFAKVLAAARRIGGDAAVATTAGGTVVEISGAGVTKASALAGLCAAEGILPSEVIAFGDAPNDLALFAFAGRSVAVGNAQPEVLAAADEITATNDEDGVALVLERILDGR
jgi:hypothetical protein